MMTAAQTDQAHRAGVIFGSSTGTTADAAACIARQLAPLVGGPENIRYGGVNRMLQLDALVLGVSTWDIGRLQQDWRRVMPRLRREAFHGKLVALFGLGDSRGYPDNFVDAMGELHRALQQQGATMVGGWPTAGYDFVSSRAVVDGRFVGLALDEDNQGQLSDERIAAWTAQIRPDIEEHLAARAVA